MDMGFPGSSGLLQACNVGDLDLIPVLGRSPGEGKSYPLQYSGLESSMRSHGVQSPWGHKESDTTDRLSLHLPFLSNVRNICRLRIGKLT